MKKAPKMKVFRASDLLRIGIDQEQIVRAFVKINKEAWPPPFPQDILWTEDEVAQHIKNCPHMQFCATFEGEIIGTVSTIHIKEGDALKCESWEKISGFGALSTHDNKGNCMFGIDLSISPKLQGKGFSDKLIVTALLSGAILLNKKGCFLGSRIPAYYKRKKIPVEDYVWGRKLDGKTMDPEVRLYQKEGFKIVKIIPNYIEDPESLNYGVLMFWENPFYKFTRFLPIQKLAPFINRLIF